MAQELETFEFKAKESGKTLLFFASIHGNEPCGCQAINTIISRIEKKELIIKKGKVIFVPIANPKAFAQKKRFIDVNLNRIFERNQEMSSYEAHLVEPLADLIDQADIFVDIHSASQAVDPFILQFQETSLVKELCDIVGFQHILKGKSIVSEGDLTTQHYACAQKKTSCLIECGQHDDPQATKNAEQAILNVMSYYGLIEERFFFKPQNPHYYYDLGGHITYSKSGKLAQDFKTFDFVDQDQKIGIFDDGEIVRAPQDCYLIMPTENPPLGEQWFFYAKRTEE